MRVTTPDAVKIQFVLLSHKKRLEFLDFNMSDRALCSLYMLGSAFTKINL